MLSDSDIIRRVRDGRIQDYGRLVERYQESVFALAYRILGRREEAEDAAQDTFVRVYQSLGAYVERNGFWPWVRRIAINCCLKKLPREFPNENTEQMAEQVGPFVDSVESEILRKCERDAILKIIGGLPELYRIPVVLRYLEDLSIAEIAEVMDEAPGTIRVRLNRALKMLSDRLVIEDEV